MAMPPNDHTGPAVPLRSIEQPVQSNPDLDALAGVLEEIQTTLAKKGRSWAFAAPLFDNFEIMQEFGVTREQFGIMMCRLKLNRLKSCIERQQVAGRGLAFDEDARDSVKDLACYAILTLAMMKARDNG